MLPVPEVSDVEMAFPANPPLPAWDDIPEEFRKNCFSDKDPWCHAAAMLFYQGGKLADFGMTPKPGVDMPKAVRALKACLGSYNPSHEHKMAGVGYMLSQWFDLSPAKDTQ